MKKRRSAFYIDVALHDIECLNTLTHQNNWIFRRNEYKVLSVFDAISGLPLQKCEHIKINSNHDYRYFKFYQVHKAAFFILCMNNLFYLILQVGVSWAQKNVHILYITALAKLKSSTTMKLEVTQSCDSQKKCITALCYHC